MSLPSDDVPGHNGTKIITFVGTSLSFADMSCHINCPSDDVIYIIITISKLSDLFVVSGIVLYRKGLVRG